MNRHLLHRALPLLLVLAACNDPTGPDPGQGGPALDELLSFNVQANNACGNADYRTARVMARSNNAIVVADTTNPAGGFTKDDYTKFAQAFDQQVYPTITRYFGKPADIDKNGRVIILFTRAVNELTPAGSNSYIGGFFHPRDLVPKKSTPQGCAGSNEAEMFYMLVPDPTGVVNGNKRSKDFVSQVTVRTLAHEFQHLINASRRFYVNNADDYEEVWLNEGLSHMAEELMFYQVSGLSPRNNLDANRIRSSTTIRGAFNDFAIGNFSLLSSYYEAPESTSPYGDGDSGDMLGVRGAIWQFLRYAADRSKLAESDLWFKLANSKTSGFANLQQVLGEDPIPLLRDWSVAAYTDDFVNTTDAVRFQMASWNHRSVLQGTTPPLPAPKAHPLSDRVRRGITLVGGGSTHLAFSVPFGPAEIRVTPGSDAATPRGCSASETLKLAIGEVYTADPGDATGLCLASGEYVLIPTSLSDASAGTLSFSVTGFGITAPLSANLAVAPMLGRIEIPRLLGKYDELRRDFAFEARLRRAVLEELAPHRGRGRGRLQASRALAPQAAVVTALDRLYVSVVRTR